MKLAVMKMPGHVPGGGYHYLLMPMYLEGPKAVANPEIMRMQGHIIIDVPNEHGERLLKEGGAALTHQCEIASLTEEALAKK